MRVATWNVNSLRVRLEHLARFVDETPVDVLCLQETKCTDDVFPADALRDLGFMHQAYWGEKTYNGVAILSRFPLEDVRLGFSAGEADPQARMVQARVQGVRIIDCYVPNGSRVGSRKFAYKLDWYRRLLAELSAGSTPDDLLLVCGDMNVAPADPDTWDPFEAEGQLLFTEDERQAIAALRDWGLVDAWRALHPYGSEFSWWDYRANGFRNNQGFRIDHVYLTRPLMARCTEARIERAVRSWDQPSDHAPVVVHLDG